MKNGVYTLLETLSQNDRIQLIFYGSEPYLPIEASSLVQVTTKNKITLLNKT